MLALAGYSEAADNALAKVRSAISITVARCISAYYLFRKFNEQPYLGSSKSPALLVKNVEEVHNYV